MLSDLLGIFNIDNIFIQILNLDPQVSATLLDWFISYTAVKTYSSQNILFSKLTSIDLDTETEIFLNTAASNHCLKIVSEIIKIPVQNFVFVKNPSFKFHNGSNLVEEIKIISSSLNESENIETNKLLKINEQIQSIILTLLNNAISKHSSEYLKYQSVALETLLNIPSEIQAKKAISILLKPDQKYKKSEIMTNYFPLEAYEISKVLSSLRKIKKIPKL